MFDAARDGDVDSVKRALRNFDITTSNRDAHGNTLLIVAAETGDRKLARMLLRFRADVNLVNSAGNTALHVAHAFRTCGLWGSSRRFTALWLCHAAVASPVGVYLDASALQYCRQCVDAVCVCVCVCVAVVLAWRQAIPGWLDCC